MIEMGNLAPASGLPPQAGRLRYFRVSGKGSFNPRCKRLDQPSSPADLCRQFANPGGQPDVIVEVVSTAATEFHKMIELDFPSWVRLVERFDRLFRPAAGKDALAHCQCTRSPLAQAVDMRAA